MRTSKDNIQGLYPLSPMQEGMLYHALADAASPAYIQQICWSLRGSLELELFERAWNTVLSRHDSLRTLFVHEGSDRPLQVVLKAAELKVDFQDLRPLGLQGGEKVAGELKQLQRTTPFNLSRDLLMRLTVLRRDESHYEVIWTHHHLLLDGWSVGIILREFLQLYSALRKGEAPELTPPVPIGRYVEWLEGRNKEASRHFWRQQLRGYDRKAEIPPSGRDLSDRRGENGSRGALLDPALHQALQERAAGCGVTLTVLLQAIWAVVLGRYNDCDDVLFGLVVSGRPPEVEGIEQMVGNLINTVPVRVRMSPQMSWRSLALALQEDSLAAVPHQYYSLAAIQGESELPSGLFATIMAMESYPVDEAVVAAAGSGAAGFLLEATTVHERTHYPLDLQFLPTAQGLRCTFFYGREQYEDWQISALMEHFLRAAAACADHFDDPVEELRLLGQRELDQLLGAVTTSAAGEPVRPTVVELFEQQVKLHPEAPALHWKDQRLSYGELNRRANLCARALIDKHGVLPGEVVAILLPRSVDYLVAILGILKAGATYLPLDPEMPEQRLAAMLRECRAKGVVVDQQVIFALPFHDPLTEPGEKFAPIFTASRPPIADLDTLPLIDRSLLDYEAYHQYIGQSTARYSAAIQATRGCPYRCAYCHRIWPKTHLRRSPAHLLNEVERLYESGFRRFVFIDDIFNLDHGASRTFFESVLKKNLHCQFFFSNGLRGDILTHDEIDLMVAAGTKQMAFALESASPRIQKLIRKNLDIERLRDNLLYVGAKYPQVILELFTMHGFPSETPAEAELTLDFIKSIRWLHFPYLFILRIFPDTEMAGIAKAHGISDQAIRESMAMGYHELPTTLPFPREVSTRYQMAFLNEYFLDRERLKQVLPHQMRVMDERSLVLKYDSYLPTEIRTIDDILQVAGMERADLGGAVCVKEEELRPPELNRRIAEVYGPVKVRPAAKNEARPEARPEANEQAGSEGKTGGLRILLLDLSQYFAKDKTLLYDVVEPPLGLASLLTVLKERFGAQVCGKIAKARIDFDDFTQLRQLLAEFKPDCIGVRTLTFYRNFFHQSLELIRQWGFAGPIIAGGPYATSSPDLLLADPNVDAAVLGEGEITFSELVTTLLRSDCRLEDAELQAIAGLAFVPAEQRARMRASSCRLLEFASLFGISGGNPLKQQLAAEAANAVDVVEADPGDPPRQSGADDAAYIIYTSGSTGNPKGVVVEHRALSNLVAWLQGEVYQRYSGPIREALVAPLIFDVSVQQIFGALSNGHTLHLIPAEIAADPFLLAADLKANPVELLNVTPSRLALLLDALEPDGALAVDQLLVGAEKLSRGLLERFYARPGHEAVLVRNMYGPTECCVDAASWPMERDSFRRWLEPPLGRAVSGIYFRVLDRRQEPVPPGVFGELYLGGEGLAREYLARPEESARSFVPDPWPLVTDPGGQGVNGHGVPQVGASETATRTSVRKPSRSPQDAVPGDRLRRLYRTGDRVRWVAPGVIQFGGRVDDQLKLRGYRIEPAEIEQALEGHPAVGQAAVTIVPAERAVDDAADNAPDNSPEPEPRMDSPGSGGGVLTAFIVGREEVTVESLQAFVAKVLPDYMIPARFVKVERLPLGATGKLDRRALLKLSRQDRLERGAATAAARSPEEAVLIRVWSAVLATAGLSIHDNYFALGGDSIKAIQVVSRLAREGWKVTIRDLFRYPSVAALAPHITPVTPSTKKQAAEGDSGRAPLTPIQAAFMENHRLEPQRFNHALVLQSREPLAVEALQAAWQQVLAIHGALRTAFLLLDGRWYQEVVEGARPLQFHDLSGVEGGAPRGEAVAAELHGSLDPALGHLAAAALLRGESGDRLLLVIHHLAVDGVSWRIILADLLDFYAAFRAAFRAGATPASLSASAPASAPVPASTPASASAPPAPSATDHRGEEGQGINGQRVPQAPAVSFIRWANTLAAQGRDSRLSAQLPYWQAVAQSPDPLGELLAADSAHSGPEGHSVIAANTYGEAATINLDLEPSATTRLVLEAHRPYNTTVEELLLCALGRALQAEHGIDSTLLTLESHGREESFGLDLSRTCGWLTVTYPFALSLPAGRDLAYQLKTVKESLRAVPDRGVGYGMLRYLSPAERSADFELSCKPSIGFNYLGRLELGRSGISGTGGSESGGDGGNGGGGDGDGDYRDDATFSLEFDSHSELAVNPRASRPHLLEVSAIISDERLRLSLVYPPKVYGERQARRLTAAWRREILELIEHCCSRREVELTPADLTYSELSLDELEGIL